MIDIPVGKTAKVRDEQQAQHLLRLFESVGEALGIRVKCVVTDGSQAVGNGIGPLEEAKDVIAVLNNADDAPADLRERALLLSSELLMLAENSTREDARLRATALLDNGDAWLQFQHICNAQGGLKPLPSAPHQYSVTALHSGTVTAMDNRRLARLAKLAGAPFDPVAGLRLSVKVGDYVNAGDRLFTLFAASPGELDYARQYYLDNRDLINQGSRT